MEAVTEGEHSASRSAVVHSSLKDISPCAVLQVDPSLTERHITHLVNSEPERPLPAAKYLLTLARKAQKGDYVSQEGKSAYQLFVDFLELAENYAEDVGLEADEMKAKNAELERVEQEQKERDEENKAVAGQDGALMRFEGAPIPIEEYNAKKAQEKGKSRPVEVYDPDTDPANADRLDIEKIVMSDGLSVYKDQAGRLWSGLATFWIKRGDFDQASETFEKGLSNVVTVRDFTQIFDAYAEFSETVISTLMTAVSDPDSEEDDEGLAEMEEELDTRMKNFEELMDRRPFLMNEVLLRRNPNEVVEWEKRVALYGDDDEKVRD
jgi:pre-mRNA-splicing factor SYF1